MSGPAPLATDHPTAEGSESTWPVLDSGRARPVRRKSCRLHPVRRGRQSVLAHLKRATSQLSPRPCEDDTGISWFDDEIAGRQLCCTPRVSNRITAHQASRANKETPERRVAHGHDRFMPAADADSTSGRVAAGRRLSWPDWLHAKDQEAAPSSTRRRSPVVPHVSPRAR